MAKRKIGRRTLKQGRTILDRAAIEDAKEVARFIGMIKRRADARAAAHKATIR